MKKLLFMMTIILIIILSCNKEDKYMYHCQCSDYYNGIFQDFHYAQDIYVTTTQIKFYEVDTTTYECNISSFNGKTDTLNCGIHHFITTCKIKNL